MSGPGSGDPRDGSEHHDDAAGPDNRSDDDRRDESDRSSTRNDGSSKSGADPEAAGDADARPAPDGEATAREAEGGSDAGAAPEETDGGDDGVTIDDGVIRWFLRTDDGAVVAIRDVASSVALVALIGLLLFGISGIWPPLVAVESGSMEPNMERGDLVFVVDEGRFAGDDATGGTGVVTARTAEETGHAKFGEAGDVIVFHPDGSDRRTPVIHRAHFWVDQGENWVDTKANPEYLNGATCRALSTCPAPHAGFVTKGDANDGYDQARGGARTGVVDPGWIAGKGMFRIPFLGYVRLTFDGLLWTAGPDAVTAASAPDVRFAALDPAPAGPIPGTPIATASAAAATTPGPSAPGASSPVPASDGTALAIAGGVGVATAGRLAG